MKRRLLRQVAIALTLAAVAIPLASAAGPYDGYKSSYPQLHQLVATAAGGADLKSSYPQLHAVLTHQVRAPFVPTVNQGFAWSDAAIGAGTAAGAIFLIAAGALLFSRRHPKVAL